MLERVFVWAHVLIILGFLAYLPHSKHLHIATAAINVFFGRTRARGRLEPLDFEAEDEAALRFGAGTIADLTWKQMLDSMSCTECGRCQDVCPAYATGKALSPKLLIMGIRDQLFAEGSVALAGGDLASLVPNAVTDDVVWDCVTCGACVHECPVSIEHVDHIVDLRRNLVMVESRLPTETETMLRDVERGSNPWGKPQNERASWADGLGVRVLEPGDPAPDVLYWVGCAAAFDERARTAAVSTTTLMRQAPASTFAILGPRESCTGDPARRAGNEYVFQALAQANIETLNERRRDEDRRELPALLQHARERVPGLRRPLRGRPPLGAARAISCDEGGCHPRAAARRSRTTTPATSRATTTCSTRRATSSRASGRLSRWRAAESGRSAAARAARTCGWRSAALRSTRSAHAKPRRPEPRRSPWRARSAPSCSTTACGRPEATCESPTSRRSSSRPSSESPRPPGRKQRGRAIY